MRTIGTDPGSAKLLALLRSAFPCDVPPMVCLNEKLYRNPLTSEWIVPKNSSAFQKNPPNYYHTPIGEYVKRLEKGD